MATMATKTSRTFSSSKRSSSSRARATVGVKLGARTVEIYPVGAWVQPGSELTSDPVVSKILVISLTVNLVLLQVKRGYFALVV